ncbi:MAG TPA: flagellar basal body rod protein FlgC [Nitrospinota bacterium]|nr:flagellar basal body rod protein FlgC [Nitrospinota bacterium]
MDFFSALKISSSGLSAQRLRMNVISSNLANANTTRTSEGVPYRRKDIVFSATPLNRPFQNILDAELNNNIRAVNIVNIIEDQRPFRLVYNPQHPDANEEGFVAMPNIRIMEEMVNLLSATRSYEANVTAINSIKNMALKALTIGR